MIFSPFDELMFNIVPIIVCTGFIVIFVLILVAIAQSAKQWKKNNESPVLTVEATVVTKRTNIHHNDHNFQDNIHHSSSSTTYYITFEVASGDRMEFRTRDIEYGMLVENDKGKLTFQGTRYLGFERNKI